MYFAGARCMLLGVAVMLLARLALSEASIGRTPCQDSRSCMADVTTQPKALVQVRTLTKRRDPNVKFDCSAGVERWRVGWSDTKKEWCCIHEQIGCDYNCTKGLEAGWPDSKKTWCCKTENIGCGFNCTEGEVANWNEDKATWCCKNELVGCGFNCSAGYSQRQQGWSPLKKKYCCKNELLGCTFNCSKDLSNRSLAWPSIKKTWCCNTQQVGCGDKRPCLTQEDALAVGSLFRGYVAPPGTPCVFGLDALDEGFHCVLSGGKYGSFGWCYTAKDRSSWGACNQDCPLFGPAKKIGDRLKNMTKELLAPAQKVGDSLRHIAKQLEGPLMSGSGSTAKRGITGGNGSEARSNAGNMTEAKNDADNVPEARSDAGNVTEEAKKGHDKIRGKTDEKLDAKNGAKTDTKKDAKKDGKKD